MLRTFSTLALAAFTGCGGAEAPARDTAPPPAVLAPLGDTLLLAEAERRAALLPRLTGMLVARDGHIISEHYWRGAGADRVTNVKSASKSVLSALLGIAIAEGKVRGVDQPVSEILPEYFGAGTDPRKRAITVGQLVSMTSGLQSTSFGGYGAWVSSRDWVGNALGRPLEAAPGERMIYSTGSTHILSAVLTRATGVSTRDYAARVLGEPLGIRIRPWQRDPRGIYFGGNDMYLTPRAMLRFGELYRNGGVRGGRRVVPREWIEASLVPRGNSDYSGFEYGYGWWLRRSGPYPVFFAWGYGGQFIFVVPELRLTAVFTSVADLPREGGHLPAVHALMDEQIVPAAAARLRACADTSTSDTVRCPSLRPPRAIPSQ
ncbi:MAG TPA: serine hydrolase [Longimicrobium sp.]|nr:serine hydrolase [Longimicrobium sp.]